MEGVEVEEEGMQIKSSRSKKRPRTREHRLIAESTRKGRKENEITYVTLGILGWLGWETNRDTDTECCA